MIEHRKNPIELGPSDIAQLNRKEQGDRGDLSALSKAFISTEPQEAIPAFQPRQILLHHGLEFLLPGE